MPSRRHLHVFVLIDALGWSIIQGRDFLCDLLPYREPLRTVLGFSSAAIPTILTGVPPAEHGHWNLYYCDPQGSPFRWLKRFDFLPERVLNHRLTRRILTEAGRRLMGLGPTFECCVSPRLLPWLNWAEKRDIYSPSGITGARSIFDQLTEKGHSYCVYSYHMMSDSAIMRQAEQDITARRANFYFLYLSEMDMYLHTWREDSSKVSKRLEWYENELRSVFSAARRADPDALFTVFSDHGMAPVRHHFDLVGEIKRLGFSVPNDYLAIYDSTMARFWFFSPEARSRIIELLNGLSCGRLVQESELRQLGVFFPDRRYGEIIFLLNPGWILTSSDFNGRSWMPAGMHGYHPDDPESYGIFLTNYDPGTDELSIADVHGYMERASLAA